MALPVSGAGHDRVRLSAECPLSRPRYTLIHSPVLLLPPSLPALLVLCLKVHKVPKVGVLLFDDKLPLYDWKIEDEAQVTKHPY